LKLNRRPLRSLAVQVVSLISVANNQTASRVVLCPRVLFAMG
jgi:hypothetical protein